MKLFINTIIVFFFCTSAIFGQKNVKKNYTVDSFNKMELTGGYHIVLTQGNQYDVYVEGKQKDIDKLKVSVKNNTLIINNQEEDDNSKNSNKTNLTVYITFENLEKMECAIAGNIENEGLMKFNNFDIDYTGVGKLKLNLECTTIHVDMTGVGSVELSGKGQNAQFSGTGVGSFDARKFIARDLEADWTGIGNMKVNAYNKCVVTSSGIGNVKNYNNMEEN
ncbi:head GIN domain-containing protein [Flammeovirga pacifica]|uniref:Putative auto-transporter adhesin head GIN domain-containing protein n=1 Tax=Flammeovirga pacifica TaxID=915059 RepID=A0A1S1Z516_FLAPC|nr:head GIN domain-containing protein [Flammeovirga pacifica]OHX68370.1 hypothetical protein NH26_19455 [Flammeovirga pacifica]